MNAAQAWAKIDRARIKRLQESNAALREALRKIAGLPPHADGVRGMVDFPHEKALRRAGQIATDALAAAEVAE